jgi:dihydrofolate reductase
LFDFVDGRHGTGEMGYGADLATTPPFFVVTSSEPDFVRLASSHDFTFVPDGPAAAVEQARAVAGAEDAFIIMGGGTLIRGCVAAGLLDRPRLHLSPIVWARAHRCSSALPADADPARRAGLANRDPPGLRR